jgi:hypothetical protein
MLMVRMMMMKMVRARAMVMRSATRRGSRSTPRRHNPAPALSICEQDPGTPAPPAPRCATHLPGAWHMLARPSYPPRRLRARETFGVSGNEARHGGGGYLTLPGCFAEAVLGPEAIGSSQKHIRA